MTQRDNTLYLHVFDWPADGRIPLTGLTNEVSFARLLATGEVLEVLPGKDGVTVIASGAAPSKVLSTIVLQLKN